MMTIKNVLLFSLFFSTTAMQLRAQDHVYDDLLILYVDEDYEKCLDKSERYTDKDKTRRDPLPYLYLSMCNHEMSKQEKYVTDPEFKRVASNALKNAEKFRKKDKEMEFFANYEDYWSELNTRAMETGFNFLELDELSKAKRQFDRMSGYYPENAGAWLMLALVQYRSKLVRDAGESMKSFQKAYDAISDIDRLPKDQQRLLREGMIRYAEFKKKTGDTTEARRIMELGKDQFTENLEFKGLYDALN